MGKTLEAMRVSSISPGKIIELNGDSRAKLLGKTEVCVVFLPQQRSWKL